MRGDWRDLLLDGADTETAAEAILQSYSHVDDEDATVFSLAFAAAQMETGRLQAAVRDKAIAIIAAGGDVQRWAADDPALARQREQVLDRLAAKLRGPQAKPKRLRRQKPLGVAFDLGDVILLRPPRSSQRALAVVVAHNDGYPRGTVNPVVELLAWDGASMPTRKQMQTMPTVMHRNNLMDKGESYLRPHLYIICTWRKERAFSSEFGEIVERAFSANQAAATAVQTRSPKWARAPGNGPGSASTSTRSTPTSFGRVLRRRASAACLACCAEGELAAAQ